MNKKRILSTFSVVAIVTISGYGGMKAYQSNAIKHSDLLTENVIALANGEDGQEKKFHHKELVTYACGESTHYVKISEKEAAICHDVITITYELCSEEGGIFTCKDFGEGSVQHEITGTITYK